jgi:GNAT superfamily N-acetyltransferase
MDIIERIAATFAWHQSWGHSVEDSANARYVSNLECPNIWVANHVSLIRASRRAEIDEVLLRADRTFAHCGHRMYIVDPLTPPTFVARLAFESFTELAPTLHMALEGTVGAPGAAVDLRPVASEDDWTTLARLVRANHLEAPVHGLMLEQAVTDGLVAGYRAKSPAAQFFLAYVEGRACAYGSAVVTPFGMGIVEDLFTLPDHRKRGIATALIARAVSHARAHDMGPMLIGAVAGELPKSLYASLGFVPQCVTRQYLRHLS